MAENFVTYKLTPRNLTLRKVDLKKLIDFIVAKNRENIDIVKRVIKFDEQTEEEKARLADVLDKAYTTTVFVYGRDGEEILVRDSMIIDSPEFPDALTRITIDTIIPFRNQLNVPPRNGV